MDQQYESPAGESCRADAAQLVAFHILVLLLLWPPGESPQCSVFGYDVCVVQACEVCSQPVCVGVSGTWSQGCRVVSCIRVPLCATDILHGSRASAEHARLKPGAHDVR